jgi:aspartyl-tRNA(Asn)/glutamyl-tRNA(Gln) amidotransferase subunit A
MGADVVETELPLDGWADIFGPLVLAEEHRERGHLLDLAADRLTDYERATLEAGRALDPRTVTRARQALAEYRCRIGSLFSSFDALLLPTVAVPAFPHRQRPREIDGRRVGSLWGAFPFTVAFNVAGTPALTLPAGLADGLPVGAQLVGSPGGESSLLDLAEDLEEALDLPATDRSPRSTP